MPRGPLPSAQARRRNPPTIPTTNLPVAGRKGRAPAVPVGYKLATSGRAWWNWAWKLPQAAAWDAGALYVIARRAQLEDDLAALDRAETFSVEDILGDLDPDDAGDRRKLATQIDFLIGKLKALSGGRVSLMREMRELDNRLGLTPKGLAELRWKIVADEEKAKPRAPRKLPANVTRLPAIDPAAAASG